MVSRPRHHRVGSHHPALRRRRRGGQSAGRRGRGRAARESGFRHPAVPAPPYATPARGDRPVGRARCHYEHGQCLPQRGSRGRDARPAGGAGAPPRGRAALGAVDDRRAGRRRGGHRPAPRSPGGVPRDLRLGVVRVHPGARARDRSQLDGRYSRRSGRLDRHGAGADPWARDRGVPAVDHAARGRIGGGIDACAVPPRLPGRLRGHRAAGRARPRRACGDGGLVLCNRSWLYI